MIDPLQLPHLGVASEVSPIRYSLRWASGLPGHLLSVARNCSLVLEHHHPVSSGPLLGAHCTQAHASLNLPRKLLALPPSGAG